MPSRVSMEDSSEAVKLVPSQLLTLFTGACSLIKLSEILTGLLALLLGHYASRLPVS